MGYGREWGIRILILRERERVKRGGGLIDVGKRDERRGIKSGDEGEKGREKFEYEGRGG